MAISFACNPLLLNRATSLRSLLNSGHQLCLFKNIALLSPATALGDLIEATFTGYARVNLAGKFNAPAFVKDGEYQLTMTAVNFTCTGGLAQDVYGWFIFGSLGLVLCGSITPNWTFTNGVTRTLQIFPQTWDKVTP